MTQTRKVSNNNVEWNGKRNQWDLPLAVSACSPVPNHTIGIAHSKAAKARRHQARQRILQSLSYMHQRIADTPSDEKHALGKSLRHIIQLRLAAHPMPCLAQMAKQAFD